MNSPRLVSNSEVQTFKDCRRKWWLSWYRGLVSNAVEVQGVRSTGTRLHIALESHYQPGTGQDPLWALRKAQGDDRDILLQSQTPDSELLVKLHKDFELEQIMLEGYLEWLEETGADSVLEVVASEQFISMPFLEGGRDAAPVTIIGKLDTRFRDVRTGRTRFMDHKSVTVFANPQLLKIDEQTLHYQLLLWLESEGEEWCDGALYNMLRRVKRTAKAKPPFFKREVIDRNRHELEAYKSQLTGVITEIQAVERQITQDPKLIPFVIHKRPSRDCAWKCPFFKVCHMFDDGSRAEDALTGMYHQANPLDYYQGKEQEE